MTDVYLYVVARDFGFAPNPFHGVCTLATCKPVIRRKAGIGDWVIGMAGSKLLAAGRCIYAMQVTHCLSFDQYWADEDFFDKRPVRFGSLRMKIGDNIYSREALTGAWLQADSHHSNSDGSPNEYNLIRDTSTNRVLVSRRFIYFGCNAPAVPAHILSNLGYRNAMGHRVYSNRHSKELIDWLLSSYGGKINQLVGLPCQFRQSHLRYSVKTDKISV